MMNDLRKNSMSACIPAWERFRFALCNFGYQATFYWVTAYLTIYCTDILQISAASVSLMMLITRLYDAVNDPIIGGLVDRTRSGLGRYRPWVMVGGAGLCVSCVLLFSGRPSWSQSGKTAYIYGMYALVVTFSTIYYMSYMALNGCLSSDAMERSKAASWREIASYAGMLLVGYLAPYMIGHFGTAERDAGYRISMLICAMAALPTFFVSGFGCRERVKAAPVRTKLTWRRQWSALLRNREMLLLIVCMGMHGIQMNARLCSAAYYCTYFGKGGREFAIFNLLSSAFSIGGCLIAPQMFRLTRHKGRASVLVLGVGAVAMMAQYFAPVPSGLMYGLTALNGLCQGAFSALLFSMIPDAVDIGQLQSDVRMDGFSCAVASFAFKLGGAVVTAIICALLEEFGYVPNGIQNNACLQLINICTNILPALLCTGMAACLTVYRLDQHTHEKVLRALNDN